MYQKLFQITLVLFLVVVSIATLAVVISVLMSAFTPQLMAAESGGGGGVIAFAYGVSQKQFRLMIVAVSLIIAGCYIFFRRRRFRR